MRKVWFIPLKLVDLTTKAPGHRETKVSRWNLHRQRNHYIELNAKIVYVQLFVDTSFHLYIYIYIYIYICNCQLPHTRKCKTLLNHSKKDDNLGVRYQTDVKLAGFRSQLKTSFLSSHSKELWCNETVCLWTTIYIYIYIYIYALFIYLLIYLLSSVSCLYTFKLFTVFFTWDVSIKFTKQKIKHFFLLLRIVSAPTVTVIIVTIRIGDASSNPWWRKLSFTSEKSLWERHESISSSILSMDN